MSDKTREELDVEARNAAQGAAQDITSAERSTRPATRGAAASVGSRMMQRKLQRRAARKAGDNGVAQDAEAAVSTASSSSGGPLPVEVARKFEASLGADLSSVRVHTGEASEVANEAVSARAYTTGNDIHFAAGQYDPSSHEGQHLLAHEVAHTVQQSGGAARKPMFKLEVSTPGDAHEIEADHAADAMVAGRPAAISSGSPAVQRDFNEDWLAGNENGQKSTGWKQPPASEPSPFHPTNPWTWAPYDWSAVPGESPAGRSPAVWQSDNHFQTSDTPGPNRDEDMMKGIDAFQGALATLKSSSEAAYPLNRNFQRARDDIDADGSLHSVLGWEAEGSGKDLGSLALAQTTKGVSVADTLQSKKGGPVSTEVSVDVSHATQSEDTKKGSQKVHTAILELKTSKESYQAATGLSTQQARTVANRVSALEIAKDEKNAASTDAELSAAKKERDEIAERIKNEGEVAEEFVKTISVITSAPENPVEAGLGAMELYLQVSGASKALTATKKIGEKIASLQSTMQGAKSRIAAHTVTVKTEDLDIETAKFDLLKSQVDTACQALEVAHGHMQSAYDEFAGAAGKAAGGDTKNQARVEAVIRALPKVAKVAGDAAAIADACVLPAYSPEAGKAFNAYYERDRFKVEYATLKGMKEYYTQERTVWAQRLQSMQAVASKLGG